MTAFLRIPMFRSLPPLLFAALGAGGCASRPEAPILAFLGGSAAVIIKGPIIHGNGVCILRQRQAAANASSRVR